MKMVNRFFIIFAATFIISCSRDGVPEKLDGTLVTIDGKQYIIKHNIGDCINMLEVRNDKN